MLFTIPTVATLDWRTRF